MGDATSRGGRITLPNRTPFVVMGDLNVIDSPSPSLATLLTGHIADERTFGAGLRPDWDASDLTDAQPHHNGTGKDVYTWRDDSQPFPPGTLDRIVYSDSAVTVNSSFVLDTTQMADEELRRAGLRATDVMRVPAAGIHDHFPVVADLVFSPGTLPPSR